MFRSQTQKVGASKVSFFSRVKKMVSSNARIVCGAQTQTRLTVEIPHACQTVNRTSPFSETTTEPQGRSQQKCRGLEYQISLAPASNTG
jgi:hypothetical protein